MSRYSVDLQRARSATAEPNYPPIDLDGRSQRFIRFHKAFHHAFKQASEKWSEDDLKACFPTLYKRNPELFRTFRNAAIEQGRTYVEEKERELNASWNVADSLDTLHETLVAAKQRAASSSEEPEESTDVWSPTLDPKAAVRAQAVPLIRAEIERLKAAIAEIEARDTSLAAEMRTNIADHAAAAEKIKTILTDVRSVADEFGTTLRTDEIVEWALEVDETGEV